MLKTNKLYSHEKEETEMHTTKQKKPILKGYILYDSNYVTS